MGSFIGRNKVSRRFLWTLAAATSGIIPAAHCFGQDTSASWNNAAGGAWETATNWSAGTVPNNGVPADTNYLADISVPGSSAYTVTASSTLAVDGLTIDSSNATLSDNTSGALTVGGLTVTAGTFKLNGGTLSAAASTDTYSFGAAGQLNIVNGTINGGAISSTNAITISNGTLNGVTVSGADINANVDFDQLTVLNGITGDGHQLNLGGRAFDLIFGGQSQEADDIIINGSTASSTGAFVSIGDGSTPVGGSTLTLGANATMEGTITVYNGAGTNSLINQGTILADGTASFGIYFNNSSLTNNAAMKVTNGGVMGINAVVSTFTNNGTITVSGTANNTASTFQIDAQSWSNTNSIAVSNGANVVLHGTSLGGWTNTMGATITATTGSTLDLDQNWTNDGTITVNNSTVILGGNLTLASMGSLSVSNNSTIKMNGSLTMSSGQVYSLPADGSFTLEGSTTSGVSNTISGGTISSSGATVSVNAISGTAPTLNNVHITGADLNINDHTSVDITNGLTIDTGNMNLNAQSTVFFDNANTTVKQFNINTIPVGNNTLVAGGPNTNAPATLTLNTTLNGGTSFSGYSTFAATINNYGTINASNEVLGITERTTFNNYGQINISALGSLYVQTGGTFNNYGSLNFARGTTFTINGGLAINADAILSGSCTINGNVTLSSDPSQLQFSIGGTGKGTTYDSMTVNGNVVLAGDLDVSFSNAFQSSITGGETFDVMTLPSSSNTMTGQFLNVLNGDRLETTDGYGSFQVNYGTGPYTNEIVLSNFVATVPEPATLSLLGLSACGLLMRRRRA